MDSQIFFQRKFSDLLNLHSINEIIYADLASAVFSDSAIMTGRIVTNCGRIVTKGLIEEDSMGIHVWIPFGKTAVKEFLRSRHYSTDANDIERAEKQRLLRNGLSSSHLYRPTYGSEDGSDSNHLNFTLMYMDVDVNVLSALDCFDISADQVYWQAGIFKAEEFLTWNDLTCKRVRFVNDLTHNNTAEWCALFMRIAEFREDGFTVDVSQWQALTKNLYRKCCVTFQNMNNQTLTSKFMWKMQRLSDGWKTALLHQVTDFTYGVDWSTGQSIYWCVFEDLARFGFGTDSQKYFNFFSDQEINAG